MEDIAHVHIGSLLIAQNPIFRILSSYSLVGGPHVKQIL